MKKAFALLVSVAALTFGCTKDYEPDPKEMGYDYYPLNVGDFRIYNIHEVRYQDQDSSVTSYQERERIDTVFTNQADELTYKVIRSKRADSTEAWLDDSIMVINRSGSDLKITRNNVKTVEMVFPVRNFKNWNLNAFNAKGAADVFYTEKGASYSVNNNHFGNTVRVVLGQEDNLLRLNNSYQIFAEQVGLVYEQKHIINYCNNPSNCPVDGTWVINGVRRIKALQSFGKM